MITANVLQRTFHIGFGDGTATAFCVDVDGRQYLVTARHVVAGIKHADTVRIYWKGSWQDIAVTVVGISGGEADVAVLALDHVLARPDLPLPATMDGVIFGQDVFFLGYPFGLLTEVGPLNADFPMALIKKATLSSITTTKQGAKVLLLDGINNPGFSGGPVVFTKPNSKNEYILAGVVSGYRQNSAPVWDGDKTTGLTVRENTGIVLAYGIDHALELIKAHPIGPVLNP